MEDIEPVMPTHLRVRLTYAEGPRDAVGGMDGLPELTSDEELRRRRFERLAGGHRDVLLEQALRLCRRDQSVADDLVQDTWLRAWRKLDSLVDESKARAWLCKILCHLWVDVCRRRPLPIPVAEIPEHPDRDVEPDHGGEPPLWERVTPEDFRTVLDQLKEPYRSVVILHDVERLRNAEIALRLNISYRTVGSRLHRAHKKIKKLLEKRIDLRREK
jgi:RNA polymerase sigma-70 factor, ECF subfamily